MAYEISKTFRYSTRQVQTPINVADVRLADEGGGGGICVACRITFSSRFLNYFDRSGSAFISARRKYTRKIISILKFVSTRFTRQVWKEKQLLLVDPMLATGGSIVVAYHELLKQGWKTCTHAYCGYCFQPSRYRKAYRGFER